MIFKFTLEQLKEKSKSRPQGYYEEILEASKLGEDGFYQLEQKEFERLALKYRPPSVFEMIKSATNAAKEAVSGGMNVRNENETEECLTKCAACEFLIVDSFRCGICGCFLNYKVKLKDWHCPKGKW